MLKLVTYLIVCCSLSQIPFFFFLKKTMELGACGFSGVP